MRAGGHVLLFRSSPLHSVEALQSAASAASVDFSRTGWVECLALITFLAQGISLQKHHSSAKAAHFFAVLCLQRSLSAYN